MQDITGISNPSSLTTSGSLPNSSLMQPLLAALGWKDLQPAIVAAEQADQALALELQQAYNHYNAAPDEASKQQLQMALDQVIKKLQVDLAYVKKQAGLADKRLAQQPKSSGYLVSWGNWLKQRAQAFFGSDDASLAGRYDGIAKKRQEEIVQLSRLHEGLLAAAIPSEKIGKTAPVLHLSKKRLRKIFSGSSATPEVVSHQTETKAGPQALIDTNSISPLARHLLLDDQDPPVTVAQFCYPTGVCRLQDLHDGTSGFVLQGKVANHFKVANDFSVYSVSSAGDINGDGLGDILVGAGGRGVYGIYVVFGSKQASTWGDGALDFRRLMDGQHVFVLMGGHGETLMDGPNGFSFWNNEWGVGSSAGDINGDGLDDIFVKTHHRFSYSSPETCYVIFGSKQANAWGGGVLDLESLINDQRSFRFGDDIDYCSSAGDINGDGLDDILVKSGIAADRIYVIFGSKQASTWGGGVLDLESLINDQRGFRFGDYLDYCSSVGDINGDGLDDTLVKTHHRFSSSSREACYVIFGSKQASTWGGGVLDLESLINDQRGFRFEDDYENDYIDYCRRGGDINGDGLDDILVAKRDGEAGRIYVVFGSKQASTWRALDLLSLMDGQRGFALQGEAVGGNSGWSANCVGDINGDGLDDIVVGMPQANPLESTNAGKSYIILSSAQAGAWGIGTLNIRSLMDGQRGFVLQGEAAGDHSGHSVSSAGDINGDGVADLLIVEASHAASTDFPNVGRSYIVFGVAPTTFRFTANNLRLAGGETVRLDNSMLALASNRVDITLLPLRVEKVEHGGFFAVGSPAATLTHFSPRSVSNGAIQFVHDGTSLAPAYRLVASFSPLVQFYSEVQVDFLGYLPRLRNNRLAVEQWLATTLQLSDLSATDRDDTEADLVFTVSNVQHGQFSLYQANGQLVAANVSQFSQQAIIDRRVQFLHDGSTVAPCYDVAVSDRRSTTASQTATISFNCAPQLTVTPFVIAQGQATTLRPQDILAEDKETFVEDIIIELKDVEQGRFAYANNPELAITTFRQFALRAGLVQFVHDGSDKNASFALRASDGHIHTPWQMATPRLKNDFNWQMLLSWLCVPAIGGTFFLLAVYMRRHHFRPSSQPPRQNFANDLREVADLEYRNHSQEYGHYQKAMADFAYKNLNVQDRSFHYNALSLQQQKSFAVCMAKILENSRLFIRAGGRGPKQLNTGSFRDRAEEIANEAIAAWEAEKNPQDRWPYPPKGKACCPCPCPSVTGLFSRTAASSRNPRGGAIVENKHERSASVVPPAFQSSEEGEKDIRAPKIEAFPSAPSS